MSLFERPDKYRVKWQDDDNYKTHTEKVFAHSSIEAETKVRLSKMTSGSQILSVKKMKK